MADPLHYTWLETKLETDLAAIAEDLESGGKLSVTDFARLAEFHRETCGPPKPEPSQAEWRDGWNRTD